MLSCGIRFSTTFEGLTIKKNNLAKMSWILGAFLLLATSTAALRLPRSVEGRKILCYVTATTLIVFNTQLISLKSNLIL